MVDAKTLSHPYVCSLTHSGDDVLTDDRELAEHDIMAVTNRDALVKLFTHLGYDTDKRQAQTADALGIGQSGLKAALKHVERISANDELQVFLFEVASVTLAHRRAITTLLNNRDGEFLFVLTDPDYDRLDFVLIERFQKEATGPGGQTVRARPLAVTVERRKPVREALRTLRRMTFTCADDLGQLEKLLSAFRIAQWSEPRFNNVALFSDHYLKHRITEDPEWLNLDAAKKAFKAIRQIGDHNKDAQAKSIEATVLPVLKELGHNPKPAKAADEGPMLRLSESVVCFPYHWLRALDTKDDNDPDRPDDVPAVRVVSEFEGGKTQWAILTNGKHWRLYCARAHGRHANFYEVDFRETLATQEADGEAFRYFWLMFRAEAFTPGPVQDDKPGPCFLDRVFDGSREYAKELGERLKGRVFEQIFPHFAEGFIAHIRANDKNADFTEDRLHDVFRGTLTLLYRLIFLLYAESLDLLPVTEANYQEVSLRKLTKELAERAGANEAQAVEKLKTAYSPSETKLYDQLAKLFGVVDEGDNTVNVPKYNGGLFITRPDPDDHSDEAKAARFLADFKVPDRYLAMGLDRLARDEDPKRHELVPVDYKSLGVRQLGSIYEGLLEFKVKVAPERMAVVKAKKKGEAVVTAKQAEKDKLKVLTRVKMHGAEGGYLRKGTVYLANDKQERKATGSYYTPDYIVKYIVEHTVGPVLEERFNELRDDFRKAEAAYRDARKKNTKLKESGLSDDPEKVANDYKWLLERLFTLRVLDPAMGSGHFLVEAVDFITNRMLAFLNGFSWNPVQSFIQRTRRDILNALSKAGVDVDEKKLTDINLLKRHVLKRCIFGVDLNPMAVELAKVSLWLDCFTLGAPLSFLDHHLKCGNSLIGVNVEEVEKTLKKSAGMFSSRFAGLMLATDKMLEVARLADSTAEQAAQSRSEFLRAQNALAPFKRILDIYTSQWFGNGLVAEKAGAGRKKKGGKVAAIEWLNSDAVSELLAANADGFIEDTGRPFTAKPQMTVFEKTDTTVLKDKKKRKPSITDRVDNKADAWFNNVPKLAAKARAEHRFFHWELEFPEVFYAPTTPGGQNITRVENAGFDAIVGNPPYVRQELIKPIKPFLSERFECHSTAADLFIYFYEQSVRLAALGRYAAYVASSTWTKTTAGKALREFIQGNTSLESFVDFGDLPVFDEATTYPCIAVLHKGQPDSAHKAQSVVVPDLTDPDLRLLMRTPVSVPQAELDVAGWRFEDRVVARLRAKLASVGNPLVEQLHGGVIYRGVTTGLNEAFVVDRAARDALVKSDKRSTEVLKPFLEGKDLKPWRAESRDLWLIRLPAGWTNREAGTAFKKEAEAFGFFEGHYPAVAARLKTFAELARARSDQGDWYWELRACAYYTAFEGSKILSTKMSLCPTFSLDERGFYTSNTSYVLPIQPQSRVLVAFLNSCVFYFFARDAFVAKQNRWYEVQPDKLGQFPVPQAEVVGSKDARLTEIAKRLGTNSTATADQAHLQAELEARVAHHYGLTEAEFTIILNAAPYMPETTKTEAIQVFRDIR